MTNQLPRGGHAPGYLREEFLETLSEVYDRLWKEIWENPQVRPLVGRLWNCTDIVPGEMCELLEIQRGSTYSQASRAIRRNARV